MARVLIVEDDLLIAKLLEGLLTRDGHEIALAESLHAARRTIAAGPVDLVLLDLNLPDGSGFELLEHIRGDLGLDLPVVILSSQQQEHSVVRGLELGATDYLTKPFGAQELMVRMRRWLEA